MARAEENQEGVERSDVETKNVGVPNPQAIRDRAEDMHERDPVQKAYKEAMTADSAQKEARAHAKIVDESPNADETPSGVALKKVVGVASDQERGERYLREKTIRRWGYEPVE